MKKNLIRLFAAAMAAAWVLSFTGCGSKSESSSAAESSGVVESSEAADETDAAVEAGLNENGKYNTLSDFVNSDLMQNQLEAMRSSVEGSGMGLSIQADGDKLIYRYIMSGISEEDIAGIAEALESTLGTQAGTFESVAASLKAAVEVENPVVEVCYLTEDGTVICSQEFTSAE